MKRLDGHAVALDLPREPALAVGRHEHDALGAVRLQMRGQVSDDPLGAARTVGFDQLGNAHVIFCTPTASATSVYSMSE